MTRRLALRRLRIPTALALALLCVLALPALAAASSAQVIRDCADDSHLSRKYSQSDLRKALENLPTDVDEYTDCRDVIRRAQLGSAGGGSGPGGTSGGGAPAAPNADPLAAATPLERAAYDKAVASGAKPVEIDGRPVAAGALGGTAVNDIFDLPLPVLIVLALLAAGGLAALGAGAHKRVLGRRSR